MVAGVDGQHTVGACRTFDRVIKGVCHGKMSDCMLFATLCRNFNCNVTDIKILNTLW